MIATVPVFQRLGSEFMPPLDEGSLLVMPTTFAGISIERPARDAATAPDHHEISRGRLGATVKAGRAETATDPAQLDMIESVITLRPRDEWPTRHASVVRDAAPAWLKRPLGPCGLRTGGRWRSVARSRRAARTPGISSPSRPHQDAHRHR